jgi:FKBP-type peptidyl-prolyl cis-trans isomerase FkpA
MIRSATTFLLLLPATLLAQNPPPRPTAPSTAKPATGAPAKPAAPAPPQTQKPVPPAPAAAAMTDEQKTLYAIGLVMSRSLRQFDLSPAELEIVKRALSDATAGKPAVELEEWGARIQPLANERGARVTAREKVASAAYLAKAAAGAGAIKTESGIVYSELQAGTGASPTSSDRVKVHYRGTLTNGTEFDSSYARNEPAEFPLGGVIKCWTEGVQRMKVGGKARLVCPSDLAYGDAGNQAIPGGAALVFEIELLEVVSAGPAN